MVKLRLARAGGKKKPFYRVVATDARHARDGRFIEQIGTYDPRKEPPALRLRQDRVAHWLSHGAQASETVAKLIRRAQADAPAPPA